MPLTALDERTALVLVDLQHGIRWLMEREALAGPDRPVEPDRAVAPEVPTGREAVADVVARAARLVAAFRRRQLPVILVRVAFSADGADRPRNRVTQQRPAGVPPIDWSEIVDELGPAATDIVVTKRQTGGFYGTDLDLQLRRRGVTGIVIGGIMTSMGVESTARAAHDHGYNVTFAADAMADANPVAHRHSVATIFPAFGEVDRVDAIIAALADGGR